jgi:maltose O-acetyltransferase
LTSIDRERFSEPPLPGSPLVNQYPVLPGVTIGERSVIGACSVVTENVPPDVFAAGNPSRIFRPR